MISGYGRKVFKQRYGSVYHSTYSELIKKDYSNLESEKKVQLDRLKGFLKYAKQNSAFYGKLYKDIDLANITRIEDLKQLPIVTKEDLRMNIEDVHTISEDKGYASFTGGTTGKSLKVIFNFDDFQARMAYLDAFKYRAGLLDPMNCRKATFSGRDLVVKAGKPVFWRHNRVYNQRLYSTFDITEENLPFYIGDINTFKPEVINGFVSAIYDVANFIESNNLELSFKPTAIFTTSETLLPFHRDLIERVFDCKVFNQYASAEGAPFITECPSGNLHYNIDTGVIELIEGNQMVVTSFTTKGTPLIRYNIGDTMELSDIECDCGSCHPVVKHIEGRKVDFLYSKVKGKISLSHLADVVKGIPNSVKKMQFVQDSKEEIEVKIVIDQALFEDKHKRSILDQMKYRFGNDTAIKIVMVDDIPREASGKFSLIKNNCK